MRSLLIAALLMVTIISCKDNAKKDQKITPTILEEDAIEMEDNISENLELGCYEYKTDENHIRMKVIKIEGDAITADLSISYAGKDKNEGAFFGNLHGDKLIGSYTFKSEGIESKRDLAFKIEKDRINEGFGELNDGGTTFKDTTSITYGNKTPLIKIDCN